MPKTTFQRFIFTLIGVIFMATTMALFNKLLSGYVEASRYSGLFDVNLWKDVGIAFAQKAPLAFLLQFFVVQKIAGKFSAKHFSDNKIVNKCIRVGITACMMAPIMCIYSNLILLIQYQWTFEKFITNILVKLVQNYIFAFLIQVLVLKDLNSLLFKAIFHKQLVKKEATNA